MSNAYWLIAREIMQNARFCILERISDPSSGIWENLFEGPIFSFAVSNNIILAEAHFIFEY